MNEEMRLTPNPSSFYFKQVEFKQTSRSKPPEPSIITYVLCMDGLMEVVGQDSSGPCTVTYKIYCAFSSCLSLSQSFISYWEQALPLLSINYLGYV
jgi:hypothetical protein